MFSHMELQHPEEASILACGPGRGAGRGSCHDLTRTSGNLPSEAAAQLMYDIAIIGAGPAGATLARLIGESYRVLLIDTGWTKAAGHPATGKCCGGLLAPDAQQMLSRFGLALPKSILVDPQLFTIRTIDLHQKLERHYQRFYMNMDRAKFDAWLVSLVPDSVDQRLDCRCREVEQLESGWRIELDHGGRRHQELARLLIGADGAGSLIRRRVFPDGSLPKPYISIQEWVETREPMPYFSTFFDARLTDYYCWSIPKNGYLAIGAALAPGKDAIRNFELLKERIQLYGYEIRKVIQREGACMERPVTGGQILCGDTRCALIGEAAGFISPSSAEGFSFAFKSAAMLAESLSGGLSDFLPRYRARASSLRRSIALKNLKSKVLFNPLLRRLAMISGLQAVTVEH